MNLRFLTGHLPKQLIIKNENKKSFISGKIRSKIRKKNKRISRNDRKKAEAKANMPLLQKACREADGERNMGMQEMQ